MSNPVLIGDLVQNDEFAVEGHDWAVLVSRDGNDWKHLRITVDKWGSRLNPIRVLRLSDGSWDIIFESEK